MPRLRQRMRCRKGSSRGIIVRPSPSSYSDSSSPSRDNSLGYYLATRSGCGRTWNVGQSSSQPSHAYPSANLQTLHYPDESPPSQPTHSAILGMLSQSAQFYFSCSMDHPRIIATIMVSFTEEPPNSNLQMNVDGHDVPIITEKGGPVSRSQSRNKDSNNNDEQERGNFSHLNTSVKAEDDIDAKHAQEDDIDEYRCLIVEEHPPSPNDI